MWKNSNNGKCYIGSAVDLSNRLLFYYSFKAIENSLKKSQSHIYKAILKHGHGNFSLTILEYCSPEQCIQREDYYLCSLPHEYNILPKAGSRLGHNHSDKTKKQISDSMTGENHPMYGKNHTEETKTIISKAKKGQSRPEGAGSPSQAIEVTDIKNNTTISYDSISEAAKALNIKQSTITSYILRNQKKPYIGIYTFKKV